MLALLAGCAPVEPEGTWLAADLHVHSSVGSNDTDGRGLPNVLAERMDAAGLDVVFVTDHSNSQGSMHCDDVEDCPNLGPETPDGDWPAGVFPASEISPRADGLEPRGHVGCLPLDGTFTTDVFVDRPYGAVTGGQAVQQCLEGGGFAVVNHPMGLGWLGYDWTSEDFDAIEVFNGTNRFDVFDGLAVQEWVARMEDGVVAVGGSDCHRWFTEAPGGDENPALGHPTTHIFVGPDALPVHGLRAGHVVVADPGTTLTFRGVAGRAVALSGHTLEGPATLTATASTVASGMALDVLDSDGTVLATRDADGALTVEVGPGLYWARVWPEDGVSAEVAGVAIANPIRVR